MIRATLLILFLAVVGASPARAYIFNYEQAKVAAYINGMAGLSNLQGGAYADSSGVNNTVDQIPKYNYSGDVGVLLAIGKSTNLLLGAEFLEEQGVSGARIYDNGGSSELADITSSVYGLGGDVGLEFILSGGQGTRVLLGFVGTYMNLSFDNTYTMTTAGTTKYPSVSPATFDEKGVGWGFGGKAYLGYEFHFGDTSTLSLVAGYRYLPLTNFHFSQGANTILGDVSSGSVVKNNQGSSRIFDMGGPFVGLSLRFYFL